MRRPGTDDALRPTEPEPWRGHVPALDGVRGFALATVMICHVLWRAAPTLFVERIAIQLGRCGWIGVDLFFVLSGYLITGILLDARGDTHYFRDFYVRRTLRIFPLYYAILTALFVVAPLVATGVRQYGWYRDIAAHQVWFWTYTTNVLLAREEHWHVAGILGHFWSLAIEEQFYLVWPAVVLALSPRQLRWACAAILCGALALRTLLLMHPAQPIAAFTMMPARADTLAAGAWLAATLRLGVVPMDVLRRRALLVLAGMVAVLIALFLRYHRLSESDFHTETIGFTCLALGCTALLALALDAPRRPTLVGRFFRNPILRVLGKYSYAMYCFHPLVQDALRSIGIDAATVPVLWGSVLVGVVAYGVLVATLTFALAYATWHLIERHFLAFKPLLTTGSHPVGRAAA